MGIDFKQGERGVCCGKIDDAGAADLRVVADAAEEPVRDARRAAAAQSDLRGAVLVNGNLHDLGGAGDDDAEFFFGKELQAQKDAEAGTERRREQAGTRGGADESERAISMTWVRAAGPWPMMMSSL